MENTINPTKNDLIALIRTRIMGKSPHRFFVAWVHCHQERFGVRSGPTEAIARLRMQGSIEDTVEEEGTEI